MKISISRIYRGKFSIDHISVEIRQVFKKFSLLVSEKSHQLGIDVCQFTSSRSLERQANDYFTLYNYIHGITGEDEAEEGGLSLGLSLDSRQVHWSPIAVKDSCLCQRPETRRQPRSSVCGRSFSRCSYSKSSPIVRIVKCARVQVTFMPTVYSHIYRLSGYFLPP